MKTKNNNTAHYNIGALIQRLRKDRRWKQKDLASRLGQGFSVSKISKWENEDIALKFDDIIALSQVFKTPISDLFKDLGAPIHSSQCKSTTKRNLFNRSFLQFQAEGLGLFRKWPLIAVVATVGGALIIATLSALVYLRESQNLKTGDYSSIDSCQVWIETREFDSSPELKPACSAPIPVKSLIGHSITQTFGNVSSTADGQIVDCNAQFENIGFSNLIYPLH